MYKLRNKLALFIIAYAVFSFVLFVIFNGLYTERRNEMTILQNHIYSLENSLLHSFNDVNTIMLKCMNDTSMDFTEQNLNIHKLRKNIPKLNEEFSTLQSELNRIPEKSATELNKIIEYYHAYRISFRNN